MFKQPIKSPGQKTTDTSLPRIGSLLSYVAVEVQPRMLARLRKRLEKAGLLERVDARLVPPGSMQLSDLAGRVDCGMALLVVHEMPSARNFFTETAAALRNGGRLLLVEPAGHVAPADFEEELSLAGAAGLTLIERPRIRRSRAALLGN